MNILCLLSSFLLVILSFTVAEEPKNFLVQYVKGLVSAHLRVAGRLSKTDETAGDLISKLVANEEQNDRLLYELEQKFMTSPVKSEYVLEEVYVDNPTEIQPEQKLVEFYQQKQVTHVKDLEYGTPILSIRDKSLERSQRAKMVTKVGAELEQLKMKGKKMSDVHALSFVVLYRVDTREVAITGYKVTKTSTKKIRDIMHEIHFGELEDNLKDQFEIKDNDDAATKAQKKESFHNHKTKLNPENNEHIRALLQHAKMTHANSVLHIMNANGTPGQILKEGEFVKDIILKHGQYKDSFVLGDVTYDPIWLLMVENKVRTADSTKLPHNPHHAESHQNKAVGGQGDQGEQGKAEKTEIEDGKD